MLNGKTHQLSMAINSMAMLVITSRLYPIKSYETTIFLWFSYGFPMITEGELGIPSLQNGPPLWTRQAPSARSHCLGRRRNRRPDLSGIARPRAEGLDEVLGEKPPWKRETPEVVFLGEWLIDRWSMSCLFRWGKDDIYTYIYIYTSYVKKLCWPSLQFADRLFPWVNCKVNTWRGNHHKMELDIWPR